MVVYINQKACTGCGICADICLATFSMGDDQHAHVNNPHPGDEHVECAYTAVESCPTSAIEVQGLNPLPVLPPEPNPFL